MPIWPYWPSPSRLLQPSLAMPSLPRPKKPKKPKISNRSPRAQRPGSLSNLCFFFVVFLVWAGWAWPGWSWRKQLGLGWAGASNARLGSAVPCRYCPLPPLSQLAVGLAKLAVAGLVGILFLIAPRFFSWSWPAPGPVVRIP